MSYPELPLYPTAAAELLRPGHEDGRPTVWDVDGYPLNSTSAYRGERPNRHEDDYAAVPEMAGAWPDEPGVNWSNALLQRHVMSTFPDMLATCVEVAAKQRERKDIVGSFSLDEVLPVVSGLQIAWSLLMYGPGRLSNGALPSHLANLQRSLPAYENGILNLSSQLNNDVIGVSRYAGMDELLVSISEGDKLVNPETRERCPAGPVVRQAITECLFLPRAEAEERNKSRLEEANPERSLAAYRITPEQVLWMGGSVTANLWTLNARDTQQSLLMTHRMIVEAPKITTVPRPSRAR